MANFANNAVTDAGRLLLADLQAGAVFIPTKIVIGSGSIPSGKTAATMTAVSSPVKDLAINKKKKTADGKVIVGGAYDNRDVTVAWYFRELALFARAEYRDADGTVTKAVDEVLYSYGNAGDTADYMPAYSTDTLVERQIDLVSWVGQSTEIELVLESGTQVTQEQKDTPGGIVGIDEDGNANMNGGTVTGLGTPVNPSDAVPKEYADLMLPLAGGNMKGPIDMSGKRVHNLPEPENDTDAATKEYTDKAVSGLESVISASNNIVMNSNFMNPLNTSGKTSFQNYTAGGTIDGWTKDADIYVSVFGNNYDDGGCSVKVSNNGDSYSDWEQELPNGSIVYGVTYSGVFAIEDIDTGEVSVHVGSVKAGFVDTTVAKTDDESVLFQINASSGGVAKVRFRISSGTVAFLKYCALYKGEFTAETIPTYSPRTQVEELALIHAYDRMDSATFGLLWENGSPSSAFAAQTIDLDTSGYKFLFVDVKALNSDDEIFTAVVATDNPYEQKLFGAVAGNYSFFYRHIRVNRSAGTVYFGSGYRQSSFTTSEASTNMAVPVRIYGLR